MATTADSSSSTPVSTIEDEARLLTSISSAAVRPPSPPHPPPAPADAADDSGSKAEDAAPVPLARGAPPPNQQYVDHSYTDYANVDEDDLRLMKGAGGGASGVGDKRKPRAAGRGGGATEALLGMSCSYGPLKGKGHGGSVVMPFPGKLLEVLDRGDLTSIIDWMPHGRAFIVKQPKVFTTQVLPRFFKQTKFLSFTRQLNLWGFKRITRGLDAGAYYHELFLPGRPNLAMRMKRQKIKGTGIRPIPNPEQEPNFYYDYPQVRRVPRSRIPIPLPPLPSERIADLVGGGRGVGGVRPQHRPSLVGSHSFLPLSAPGGLGAAGFGLPGIQGSNCLAASSAAAAELRLQGSMDRGGILSNASVSSLLGIQNSNVDRPGLGGGLDPRGLFLRGRAPGIPAPRSFRPATSDPHETHDEISLANRRLMERLLDPATGGTPAPAGGPERGLLQRHRRPSCLGDPPAPNDAALLALGGDGGVAAPPRTAAGKGSFAQLTHPSKREGLPLPAAGPGVPSLFGQYPPSGPARASRVQDVGVATVTKALREARRLEEMARSQRAAAQALAGALTSRARAGGYEDLLPSLGASCQEFNNGAGARKWE